MIASASVVQWCRAFALTTNAATKLAPPVPRGLPLFDLLHRVVHEVKQEHHVSACEA